MLYNHKNHGCTRCGRERTASSRRLSIEEAEKRFPDMVRGQVWEGDCKKYDFLCSEHGTYSQSFDSHRRSSCPQCGRERTTESGRLTIDEAERRFPDMVKEQKWTTASHKYLFECPIHGQYKQRFCHRNNGSGCPHCKESKGEKEINTYLKANHHTFETEAQFSDCRNEKRLPFDFFVPSLNLLIEFQGEQHWHIVKHFGGEKKFLRTIARDKIKREWALANGYHYVEVPYWYRTDPAGIAGFLDKKFAELRIFRR